VREIIALSWSAIALASSVVDSVGQHRQRHPCADALDRLQQLEPRPFAFTGEADEPDHVLADQHLGVDLGEFADRRQGGERSGRAEDVIADAADIDRHPVLAIGVDAPLELPDHAPNA
jgi:hypothetical protein